MTTPKPAAPAHVRRMLVVEQLLDSVSELEALKPEQQLAHLEHAQRVLNAVLHDADLPQRTLPGVK
ncbi:hypothetical protein [Tessaracoccus sp. OH4464_COT-324]|uniref:hypothetical protein n=1 Tax=Tessaracoccus sp. OH4464_COT-324 TaxID=2491059 RepID=UPI000F63FFA3|nr:hypothetical protein [Tessaracoccus sp. OH4464_COT-324]RRD47682.1 hypothetical protein EII42_00015 [Tessaracoccus sp. OH4464_COT-324]